MLNDQLLEAFMNGFYGFGNYHAPYWFIGMEEGGKATFQDIAKQLDIWDKWGRKELLDVVEYAHAIGMNRWYGEHPALQPTWRNLIRVFLIAEGRNADNATMRQYQKTKWGTEDGETCVVELMPLPSPDTSSWLYKEISALPYLISRKTYREYIVDSRIAHLQNNIMRYKPKAVVCYGSGYDSYWKRLANVDVWKKSPEGVNYSVSNSTIFVATKHPTRSTNEHFHNIGKLIAGMKSTEL
ncbi:MAG TPA: hypothetical protein VFQ47_04860 [Nitrososphaera sp.]|nr:hypothetical protein [Nitrososphaera sp.]